MIPTCVYCGRWQQHHVLHVLGREIHIWSCRMAECRERELDELTRGSGHLSFSGVES